jgi:hypothetical protein
VIDYRDELDFRVSIIAFLVGHLSVNNKGKKILTVEKLKILAIICLTPHKLSIVADRLLNASVRNVHSTLYDDSSSEFTTEELSEVTLLITYMCSKGIVKIHEDDERYIFTDVESNSPFETVINNVPQYLLSNVSLIKQLSRKSESMLTKTTMGL